MTTFLIVHTVTMIRRIPNQSKRAQDNIQRATVILFIQVAYIIGYFSSKIFIPVWNIHRLPTCTRGYIQFASFEGLWTDGSVWVYRLFLTIDNLFHSDPFLIAVVFFFSHGLFISIISIAMSKDHRLSIVIFLRPKENQITVLSPPSTDSPSRRRSSSKFV